MAYIPQNKYQIKYTNGNEYRLVNESIPYVGNYIELSNGKIFAGDNIQNLRGALILINNNTQNSNVLLNDINNKIYSILKPDYFNKQKRYISIPASSPFPNIVQYNQGSFKRYLAVRLNTREYKEISKDVFDNFTSRNYDKDLHKVFSINWSLLENNEEINNQTLLQYESQLPGIFEFFPDKSQYGLVKGVIKIRNNSFSRLYPDGVIIPKLLPLLYQLGNTKVNSITNEKVPNLNNCKTCFFFQKEFCSKWKAEVRNQYWCPAYKPKDVVKQPIIDKTPNIQSSLNPSKDKSSIGYSK